MKNLRLFKEFISCKTSNMKFFIQKPEFFFENLFSIKIKA